MSSTLAQEAPKSAPPSEPSDSSTLGYGVRNAQGTNRVVAAGGLAAAVLVLLLSVSAFVVGQNDNITQGGAVGAAAADFSLRNDQAERVTLAELVGDRPVVLLFCGSSGAGVNATHAATLGGVGPIRVVAVRQGTGACPPIQALADAMGEPVIDLDDSNGAVAERYGVTLTAEVPTQALLVDKAGMILDRGSFDDLVSRLPARLAAAE
ncbi:MAG: hypothetical protein AAGK78_04190 [Planctomycetota bacterium]